MTVFPAPETQVALAADIERRTLTTPDGDQSSFEPRLSQLSFRRNQIVLPTFSMEIGLLPSIFAAPEDYGWVHPRAAEITELYNLFPKSDLGLNIYWSPNEVPFVMSFSITNGEGQEAESGQSKMSGLVLTYNPVGFFDVQAGYATGNDERNTSNDLQIQRLFGKVGLAFQDFSFSFRYFTGQEPSARITRSKSFDEADLTRLGHEMTKSEVWRAESILTVSTSHRIYLMYDDVRPVLNERDYDARQYFLGWLYEMSEDQNLSLFYYRIKDEEKHSLRANDADGFGISYRIAVDL